jgi:hypothetical protein
MNKLISVVDRRFWWKGGEARIMASVDGYWMARKKGCLPFVVSEKEAIMSDFEHMMAECKTGDAGNPAPPATEPGGR